MRSRSPLDPSGLAVHISTASFATRSAASRKSVCLGDFPTAHRRDADVVSRARDVADLGRDRQVRRRRVQLLLDVAAFARREVAPLVAVIRRDVHRRHAGHALRLVDDRLRPRLLVGLRDRERRLRHRRDVVLDVLRHLRELEIGLLRDRARLGDFRRDARDALDLVLGDDRARRKTPHAAVHDAHAEAGGGRDRRQSEFP